MIILQAMSKYLELFLLPFNYNNNLTLNNLLIFFYNNYKISKMQPTVGIDFISKTL